MSNVCLRWKLSIKYWLWFGDDNKNATVAADVRGEEVLDIGGLARIGHIEILK